MPPSARAHIVIGIDFSECSRNAARAALSLAHDLDATLVLVHAFSHLPRAVLGSEATRDPLAAVQASVDAHEARVLSTEWAGWLRGEGADVQTVAQAGDAAGLVVETARKRKAAFIVVGTNRRGGIKRFFLGSVAEGIVRTADRPVLVVPTVKSKRGRATARKAAKSTRATRP